MEKLMIAANSSKINQNFIDFSIYIPGFTRAKVVGIFPEAKAELRRPATKAHYARPDTALGIEFDYERYIAGVQGMHTRSIENAFVGRGISCSV